MCGAINACIYGINYDIDDYAEHTSSLANEIYELEVVCLGKYQRALDEKHSQRTFLFGAKLWSRKRLSKRKVI